MKTLSKEIVAKINAEVKDWAEEARYECFDVNENSVALDTELEVDFEDELYIVCATAIYYACNDSDDNGNGFTNYELSKCEIDSVTLLNEDCTKEACKF